MGSPVTSELATSSGTRRSDGPTAEGVEQEEEPQVENFWTTGTVGTGECDWLKRATVAFPAGISSSASWKRGRLRKQPNSKILT